MNPTKRMLLELEAAEHRKGWDRPPMVGALLRQPGAMAVAQLFGDLPQAHLPTLVGRAARQLLDAPQDAKSLVDTLPGLYGVVSMSEGWTVNPDTDPAEVQAWKAQGKSLGDLPGSIDSRVLCALTLNGEMWFIIRLRGQPPKIMRVEDTPDSRGEGAAFLSLRLLLGVFVLHLPHGEKYIANLVTEEMLRIHQDRQGATRPNSSNAE